jgi:hypothetical protein
MDPSDATLIIDRFTSLRINDQVFEASGGTGNGTYYARDGLDRAGTYSSGHQSLAPLSNGYGSQGLPSIPNSLNPQSAIISTDGSDDNSRPSLQRSGTTASVFLRTQKTKAVDLSSPPYTRQYIDQYRHRIKADPDPEAHFLYAKYLIDAAKKIGADAKDQRSVKKYRDILIVESLKVIRRLATQGQAYEEAQFLPTAMGQECLGFRLITSAHIICISRPPSRIMRPHVTELQCAMRLAREQEENPHEQPLSIVKQPLWETLLLCTNLAWFSFMGRLGSRRTLEKRSVG